MSSITAEHIQLQGLDEESAIDLLLNLSKKNKESASQRGLAKCIVRKFECSPIAISVAANIIFTESCPLDDFMAEYHIHDLIQNENGEVESKILRRYGRPLATVWDWNFESIKDESTRLIIDTLAFLDHTIVKESVLLDGASKILTDPLRQALSKRKYIKQTRGSLVRSGLVSYDEESKTLRMHPLVQESCHIRMAPMQRQQAFDMAVTIIRELWPTIARNTWHQKDIWSSQQEFVPHVMSLAERYESSTDPNSYAVSLKAPDHFPQLLRETAW